MIATRAENLVLDAPAPAHLQERGVVPVQELVESVDPVTGEPIGYIQDTVVPVAVPLRDGRVVYPRNAFSSAELIEAGYSLAEASVAPARRVPFREAFDRVQLRDKQLTPFNTLVQKNGDCYVVLGTGRGKTVLALLLAARSGYPALVFVDNGGLMEQWVERATDEGLFALPKEEVGRCTGPFSSWEWGSHSVCVTTFQSFGPAVERGEVSEEFLNYFGWVFFDEAHVVITPTRFHLLSLFRCNRVCLTATPERRGWERIAYQHVSVPTVEDREPDLVPDVFVRSVKPTKSKEYPLRSMRSYTTMSNDLLGTDKRKADPSYLNACVLLLEELRARGRTTMVLSPRTRFLERLQGHLPGMEVIDGSVGFEHRPGLLKRSDIVGVTTSIGEKALDRVDLDALVMVVPVGSSATTRMRQGAGRILRHLSDKSCPEMYILYPDCGYGKKLASANADMCARFGYQVLERPEFDEERERAQKRRRDLSTTRSSGVRRRRPR